jgi:hypothetical protein
MDTYIKFFFHTLSALQCGHPVSHGEHPVQIPILPTCEPVCLYWLLCDIPDPCLQIFTSCNLQPTVIFQQDGAPPHWGRIVRDCLDATFPNRWLGRDGSLAWPPRSPDITPLDFFLWRYVKDKVYATKGTGVEDLKTRIRDVITTINRGMPAHTWEVLEFLPDVLRATQGAHIEVRWVYEKK